MEIKCDSRSSVFIAVLFTCTILTTVPLSECGKNKPRDFANTNFKNNSNSANQNVRRISNKIVTDPHSPLLPLPPPQGKEIKGNGKSRRGSRDQVIASNATTASSGKNNQAKGPPRSHWLAVASAVAHSAAAETNHHIPIGDDSKPTKYHYYPHNQHLYLLPECATQQVCSAVYLRLNYSQPLCACPNFHEPCSVSTRTDDRHTIPLVTGSQSPVLTLVKTCEPTQEVRECRAPKDWSILALQNSRTGKAHYLVICRCPSPGYLEGPIAHSQPAYARVPGIRVYGMTCVRTSTRTGRFLNTNFSSDKKEESSRGTNPVFPWHRLKALLHSAGLISYNTTVPVSEQKPVRVREFVWCIAVPPRCSRYTTKIKTITRNETIEKTKSKSACCKGYQETPNGKKCTPICSLGCVHGQCVAPDVCECQENFGGPDCALTCPDGKWGKDCADTCQCLGHGSKCDVGTGVCTCGAGWTGEHCDTECPPDSYGVDCKEECRCKHGGSCHHVSGLCSCSSGWTGPLCEDPCPEGTHGSECSSQCKCQNGGTCNPVNGKCRCTAGWRGEVCANPCPLGKWGIQCKLNCECFNGGYCHPVTGQCTCPSGYFGSQCHLECPAGTFGVNCTTLCNCQNDAHCNPVNGTCTCEPGWTGRFCDTGSCSNGFYGPECQCKCTCNVNNTKVCHSRDGRCVCKSGWTGRDCNRPCPFNKWGDDCSKICECGHDGFCDPVDGKCICPAGFTGDRCETVCPEGTYGNACEHKCSCKHAQRCRANSGECICEKGWTGLQCDKECEDGYYGENCKEKCDCKNNGVCNHVTGECKCHPGFHGVKCEQSCPAMMFGLACKVNCSCNKENTIKCDAADGSCKCKDSWRGLECDTECERGFWGDKCDKRCDCGEGDCHQRTGICRCPPGRIGEKCREVCPDGTFGLECAQNCPACKAGTKCDAVTGKCICPPSYTGWFCTSPCPQDYYGPDCRNKCKCKNNGDCDPKTGECRCLPGWVGRDCSQPCPKGKFGFNCTQHCQCTHGDSCRPNDGECRCFSGWTGPQCSQSCPEGYYGDHCMHACTCPSDDYVCDPVKGCVILESFDEFNNQIHLHGELDTGSKFSCFKPIPQIGTGDAQVGVDAKSTDSSGQTGKIVGIVTSILFVGVIVACIVVYYRRKLKKLKEVSGGNVHYIANPLPPGHRPGYDNPMYNYQARPDNVVPVGPLNNQKDNFSSLKNNLTKQYRAKCLDDDDEFSSRGATSSHGYPNPLDMKNREADATNGNLINNIYTSIENVNEDFQDHHYDEINQKRINNSMGPEEAYDRLDYSRASSTVNPQYTQMSTIPRRYDGGASTSRASSSRSSSSTSTAETANVENGDRDSRSAYSGTYSNTSTVLR